jgi:23S rRNA pseudouridine1911/1915/1917 synthase
MNRTKKTKYRPPFPIIYEDEDIIIIDKPVGLLAVPIPRSGAKNARDLLNQYLLPRKQKAIIVHRIDRYTSGLMVFAKNKTAHGNLVKQFLAHTPKRVYLALVRGVPESRTGELRHYLKLTNTGFRQLIVRGENQGGTLAVTRYKVVEDFHDAALLEVELDTGLKNQIRVQLNAAGHPIIGDRHYVRSETREKLINHQALHAYRLGFVHPRRGEFVVFKADLPPDFIKVLQQFRSSRKK